MKKLKNQKRILIVTERWYPDTFGGSERLAFEQLHGLEEAGYRVDVFVATNLNALPLEEHSSAHTTLFRAPAAPSLPANQLISINLLSRKTLAHLLTKNQYDAILCHHPQIGSVVVQFMEATINMHTPILYFFHSSQAQEIRVDGPNRWYPGRMFWNEFVAQYVARKEETILAAAAKIFYFSQFSGQVLNELNPEAFEKAELLHPGIETSLYDDIFEKRLQRRDPDSSVLSLFTIRRLTKRMGIHGLIRVLTEKDHDNAMRLRIAGNGPLRTTLEELIRSGKKEAAIRLLGSISMKELREEFVRADAFVLPTIALEGFGIATLEAMLSGVPVIATNAGATPELLRDVEPRLIADGSSPETLYQTLLWFSQLSIEQQEAIGKRCRAIALKKYSRDGMNQAIVAAIKKLRR